MPSIDELYGEVDNLTPLKHPHGGKKFRFLSPGDLIVLSERLTEAIIKTGYQTAIVSETGASPLAEVCERIAKKRGANIHWIRMKFPREPVRSIKPILNYYLLEAERVRPLSQEQVHALRENSFAGPLELRLTTRTTLQSALNTICEHMPSDFFPRGAANPADLLSTLSSSHQTPFQKAISIVIGQTRLAEILSQPFIFFDEYVDSGTTLRNAITFFKCYTPSVHMKLASYYVNVHNSESHENIAVALADAANQWKCHKLGAYPFENRVDLIGHFYRITDEEYVRIRVRDIAAALANIEVLPTDPFFAVLSAISRRNNLLPYLRESLTLRAVRDYVQEQHVLRLCLWQLEVAVGNRDLAELLFQAYDMYGPSWSPMPTDYHFDFYSGCNALAQHFQQLPVFNTLTNAYRPLRPSIFKAIADIFQARRKAWIAETKAKLEERYAANNNEAFRIRYPVLSTFPGPSL